MGSLSGIALEFAICALAILLAGAALCRYGDAIARESGLGATWVGVLLMAIVTSVPELVTGVSSVRLFDAPDVAAGDAIGSCMFNLVILALLDLVRPVPSSARVHHGHVLSAAFGIVQLGLAAMAILAGTRCPALGGVGLLSVAFVAVYLVAMRLVFAFEKARMREVSAESADAVITGHLTLAQAIARYSATAPILIVAAILLPGIGQRLAEHTGLGQGFVGTTFVAITTSFPEIVVSAAAVRLGAVDMAVANLFGSNLFNVAILGIDDVVDRGGPLLASVSPTHLITLAAAMTMTAVAIVAITDRGDHRRRRMSWEALAILTIYVGAVVLLRSAA